MRSAGRGSDVRTNKDVTWKVGKRGRQTMTPDLLSSAESKLVWLQKGTSRAWAVKIADSGVATVSALQKPHLFCRSGVQAVGLM